MIIQNLKALQRLIFSKLNEIADNMASKGLRVLAFAKKKIVNENHKIEISDVDND